MSQLGQFLIHHWALWLALAIILALIFVSEAKAQKNKDKSLTPIQAVALINHEQAKVIDLRDSLIFQKGHIVDAISASLENLGRLDLNLFKSKPIILIGTDLEMTQAAQKLKDLQFEKVCVLSGGLTAWQNAGLPLVKGK